MARCRLLYGATGLRRMTNMDFSRIITDWYSQNKRNLPWRDIKDPYRIWISEIILQQTQVAQGYEYYLRFVERFPDVKELASADETEVLRLWQGLGYYSRARNLHAAARQIMAAGGEFPRTYSEVRALKGVGDYTAAAICAFAYGLPCAAVDGNVYRVLSRYLGIETPVDTTAGKRLFAEVALEMMGSVSPADYNQALMDFGALQCTPQAPQCASCPLSSSCQAYAEGAPSAYPVKSKKVAVTDRYFTYFILRYEDCIYLRRRQPGDIWAGLYEPYLIEHEAPADGPAAFEELLQHIAGPRPVFRTIALGMRHILTHRRLNVDCYEVRLAHPVAIEGFIPVHPSDIEDYPLPKLVCRLLDRIDG